ncbi:DUF4136 domain-containing protein [Haloferula chungangensis]|uniref:DUF4136 domain-containing protein n=1 Tax=Haloferula chungangensis TaxID=1048331 RepID=A0ABW2L4A3_9BACT
MKTTFLFLAAATALALNSCSDTSMQVDVKPVAGVNYAAYNTYEWAPLDRKTAGDLTDDEAALRDAFKSEVDSILKRRGLTLVGQGKSDLIVYASGLRMAGVSPIGTSPTVDSAAIYPPYYEPDDSASQWLGGTGYLTDNTKTSVRFLISEAKTDKVVWQSSAVIVIDDKRPQPLAEHDARLLAGKLTKGYPSK